METMTSFGILQHAAVPSLIPDLPSVVLDELRASINAKESHRKDMTPIPADVLFLGTALNMSSMWLHEYWTDVAEVMADAISGGEALSVLRSLDIVLSAVVE